MHERVQDTHTRSQERIIGYWLCGKHGDSLAKHDRLFCGTATPLHLTTSHAGSLQPHVPNPFGVTQLVHFCRIGGKGYLVGVICNYLVPNKLLSMCLFRSLLSLFIFLL